MCRTRTIVRDLPCMDVSSESLRPPSLLSTSSSCLGDNNFLSCSDDEISMENTPWDDDEVLLQFPLSFALLTYYWKMVVDSVRSSELTAEQHYLGPLDKECRYCQALHWSTESIGKDRYGDCCLHGKVVLPFVQHLPHLLHRLYTDNDCRAKEFRCHIR